MPNLAVDVDSWARSACYPRSTFYPLSDGHSTLSRRITRADFRLCSTSLSRSQACLCSCALHTIADRIEQTLTRASVTFWEATATVKLPTWHGPHGCLHALGYLCNKGSIPRVAPRKLALSLLRLLPILYVPHKHPMPSYSEGSRGLSVLPQEVRIFTNNAISPGLWLRQCPSRYAIRAGRNLPDKEFRYLRTVIVTAAVYWGLVSMLRQKADTST